VKFKAIYTHIHIPFNVPLSGTTQVSRYQKGKTNLDFTEARDSEWQWQRPCNVLVVLRRVRNSRTIIIIIKSAPSVL